MDGTVEGATIFKARNCYRSIRLINWSFKRGRSSCGRGGYLEVHRYIVVEDMARWNGWVITSVCL